MKAPNVSEAAAAVVMGRRRTDARSADATDRAIGLRIRSRRLEIKMSQTELATSIGVTFQQIQKYEKGVNRVAASTLMEIAEALGVGPINLLPGTAEVEGVDDPAVLEIMPALALLNAEGRRLLLRTAKGLASDESLRKAAKRRD